MAQATKADYTGLYGTATQTLRWVARREGAETRENAREVRKMNAAQVRELIAEHRAAARKTEQVGNAIAAEIAAYKAAQQ